MPCEWNPTQQCGLTGYATELTEHAGKFYCAFHLPLESERKLDCTVFGAEFARAVGAGALDFSGVVFPGRNHGAAYPTYNITGEITLREIEVGDGATIVYQNVSGDLSGATFHGVGVLQGGGNGQSVVCKGAIMTGNFTFEGIETATAVTFDGSKFLAASRFNGVGKLPSLSFIQCPFAMAPIFGLSQELPQNTRFDGATFTPRPEDEHAYRIIRIHFSKNRDRDAEGKFYALEKRCQRLGLPLGWTRVVSFLYDKTSEYGYSYERAISWFCAVQAAFCFTYACLTVHLSGVVAFTFAQIVKPFELFSSKGPTGDGYEIVGACHRGLWQFLTALQSIASIALLALFLLALRWRFRRE